MDFLWFHWYVDIARRLGPHLVLASNRRSFPTSTWTLNKISKSMDLNVNWYIDRIKWKIKFFQFNSIKSFQIELVRCQPYSLLLYCGIRMHQITNLQLNGCSVLQWFTRLNSNDFVKMVIFSSTLSVERFFQQKRMKPKSSS